MPRVRDRIDQNKLFKVVRGLKSRLGRLAVPLHLAIDSTGFSCTSASRYFCTVVQRNEERALAKGQRSLRRHLK